MKRKKSKLDPKRLKKAVKKAKDAIKPESPARAQGKPEIASPGGSQAEKKAVPDAPAGPDSIKINRSVPLPESIAKCKKAYGKRKEKKETEIGEIQKENPEGRSDPPDAGLGKGSAGRPGGGIDFPIDWFGKG